MEKSLRSATTWFVISVLISVAPALAQPAVGSDSEPFCRETVVQVEPTNAMSVDDNALAIGSTADEAGHTEEQAVRPVFNAAPTELSKIDQLTDSILRKEIELLKLNTRFRAESTKTSKWKPWRLFAYGLAGNVVTNIGIDHIAYARWKYWQRPALATKPFLRKGPICLLIGHSIIASGVLIESALDGINDRKLKRQGFDRATCRQRVIAIRDEVGKLMTERAVAVSSAPVQTEEAAVLAAEGKVLKDAHECAMDEYVKLSARAAKWKVARNTSNAMILGNAATGGYVGSLGNLLAVNNRRPRLALPAGLGFIVSGGFIVLNAPTTKVLSTVLAKREGKKERIAVGASQTLPETFDSSRQALRALVDKSPSSVLLNSTRTRLQMYELQNDVVDMAAKVAKAEARAANKEFVEKLIVGAAAGGTKIAWGTNLVVAGSAWSNTAPGRAQSIPVVFGRRTFRVPIRPPKTPAQMFSRRVAQGATCQVVGSGLAALDVLQARARGEIRAREAKARGNSPSQFIATRLKKLEEMERQLDEKR